MNVFRRDGSSWTIVFGGKLVGKPDGVGLFYIRLLLERQRRALVADRVLSVKEMKELRPSGQDQAARRAALMAKILPGPHVPREQTQANARREALEQGVRAAPGDDERGEPSPADVWEPVDEVPAQVEELLGVWHWGNTAKVLSWDGHRLTAANLVGGREDRFALVDGRLVGVSGHHNGEPLEVVRRPDGGISHLVCSTFVLTRTPYDPDSPVPGGPPPR